MTEPPALAHTRAVRASNERRRKLPLLSLILTVACASAPRGSSEGASALTLETRDAEVWSWSALVNARVIGQPPHSCAVVSNRHEHAATISGAAISATIPLDPGENVVSVRCTDASARTLRSASARLIAKLRDVPAARARFAVHAGKTLALDGSESAAREGSGAALRELTWTRVDRSLTAVREETVGSGPRLELPLPNGVGDFEFALHVRDTRGAEDVAHLAFRVDASGQVHERDDLGPTWLDGAVVYGVVPPLYGEPPLAAVTRALDTMRDLGVRALWLSPVFDAPGDDFGYAVTDYFRVRPQFGGTDALRTLIREAHTRGLRVLLDLVINHSSAQHPYFVEAQQLGERSHYFDFYQRGPRGEPQHYFDWEHLPNFNYALPELRNWALAFSHYWVHELQADGYRVDAAWGVRQRQPDFFPQWSAALRRVNPDVLLLAEASVRDPYYLTHGFDAAYDWSDEIGHHAWERVFTEQAGIAARLSEALAKTEATSARASARAFRFLNNNDTGKRFITRFGEPLTRVATALLLTLPGIPCLYALDEEGAEYEPYAQAEPVRSERSGLFAYHKTLVALRANTPALASGNYQLLAGSASSELFAFARKSKEGELAVVALNFGPTPIETELAVTTDAPAQDVTLRDALMGTKRTLRRGRLKLRLAPWEVHILVPEAIVSKG